MNRPPEDTTTHREKAVATTSSKDLVPITTKTNGADSKVPAPKFRNRLASFKALTDQFDEQVKKVEELFRLWGRERHLLVNLQHEGADADDVRDLLAGAREGAELCVAALQQQWAALKTLENIHHPPNAYFLIRIGEMLGKFPEEKLSKEAAVDYGNGLAERLEAEDLSVMVLEAVFCEIEDGSKKPPAISDVLPLLKRHKNKWKQRLDAIDLDNIQRWGEETIFALDFKNMVFREATLEYLDVHGHTDLAEGVRADDLVDLHFIAIHSTAQTEGMTELVAELEAPHTRSEIFQMARNFTAEHIRAEWMLRMLNAQRRLNRGKSLACRKCGAGYDSTMRCKVCEDASDIVGIKLWDEHAAAEAQPFEAELEQRRLLLQHEQQHRKKLECQRREQFVETRSAMVAARREQKWARRLEREEDMEWARIAQEQKMEEFFQRNEGRALEEHWEKIAAEYDLYENLDAETIDLIQRGVIPRQLTDEEFAELKDKARRELIERARRVIEEQRDEAMRVLSERLATLEDWKDGVDDPFDVIRELQERVSDLEYDRSEH
jgi:hypothetical protein